MPTLQLQNNLNFTIVWISLYESALCLYGTIGGIGGKSKEMSMIVVLMYSDIAFPHYQKFILEKNNVDVFIHSWDLGIEKDVVSNYKPKISEFENK